MGGPGVMFTQPMILGNQFLSQHSVSAESFTPASADHEGTGLEAWGGRPGKRYSKGMA